jgi:PAS domain S-box-containing protein
MELNGSPPGAAAAPGAKRKQRPPSECTALDSNQLRLLAESFARTGPQSCHAPSDGAISLIEIGLNLGSERDPARLLTALCRASRNIVGARQAILRIGDENLVDSIHLVSSGVEETDFERLQSADLRNPTFNRLTSDDCLRGESLDGNPAASGLPSGFPQTFAWLAAPIRSATRTYGWICFIDKIGARGFNEPDESLAATLSSQIGRIYERNCLSDGSFIRSRESAPSVGGLTGTVDDLRASEELFRSAFDHTNVAMVITDLDNRFLRANAAFARMFGCTQAELMGMTMADVTHPDDLAESYAKREELIRGDEHFFQIEKRYLHKTGRTLWGLTNVSLMRGRHGEPLLYVGQVQDVTERKEAQQALAASEQRFRALADSIPQIVWAAGSDGAVDYLNERGKEYSDLGAYGLLGWNWERAVHPDDVVRVSETWNEILKTGIPRDIEFRLRRADGQYRWHISRQVPIRDERHAVVRWFGTCTDIEDQKRTETALRESEGRYRSLAELSADGIFVNKGGRITYANPALQRMLRANSMEDLVGKTPFDIIHPDFHRMVQERISTVVEKGEAVPFVEEKYLALDGTVVDVEIAATPFEEQGELAVLVTSRDLTERKRADEALRENESRYRRLFEANPHPMWVFDVETLRFLAVNDAAIQGYGYTHEEFLEMTVRHLRPCAVFGMGEETLSAGSGNSVAGVWRHRRKNGTLVDVAVRSADVEFGGRPARLVLAEDITARGRA